MSCCKDTDATDADEPKRATMGTAGLDLAAIARHERRNYVHEVVGDLVLRGVPLVDLQREVLLSYIDDGPVKLLTADQAASQHKAHPSWSDPAAIGYPRPAMPYDGPFDHDEDDALDAKLQAVFDTGSPLGQRRDHTYRNEAGADIAVTNTPAGAECPHPPGRCVECTNWPLLGPRGGIRYAEVTGQPVAGTMRIGDRVLPHNASAAEIADAVAALNPDTEPALVQPSAWPPPLVLTHPGGAIYEAASRQFDAAIKQQERILWRSRATLGDEAFAARNGMDIAKLPDYQLAPPDIQGELADLVRARLDQLHGVGRHAASTVTLATEDADHE